MTRSGTSLAFWLAAGLAVTGSALAQTGTAPRETITYDADYFASFAPRTALDMVERVPGFVIDEGEERRGFAGAQSNVLIDGAAPTSKAQEIDDILAAIPARDVERIELFRGAGSSAGSAQTLRVNIVRRTGAGAGVWQIELARVRGGSVSPSGALAWSGRRGAVEYGVSAALDTEHTPVRGARSDFDAAGAPEERRTERIPADERQGRLAAETAFPWLGGAVALNGQLSRNQFDERENASLFDDGGAGAGSISTGLSEREDVGELGLSYRRGIGGWEAELAAIVTRRRFSGDETTREFDALGAFEEAAEQVQRLHGGETIMRMAAQRPLSESWRVEFGAELALNTLEQRLRLIEDDGGGPAPVVLPSANVRVEEERGEAFFMLAGPLAPRWTLEAGAAVEASRLTQSGDTESETEFTFWKPTLQFVRSIGERNQLRLRVYRDVGQLDFEDFVSAADITSSIIDGGNPDLRPETLWRLEAAGDWRFGDDGAVGITLYRWWVEDALDIVPVGPPGDQIDAPGNIGDANVFGARASLAWPLPFGSQLQIEAMAQQSEAVDPLTGEERALSGSEESTLSIELRQDIERFHAAWGVEFESEREASSYRLDRIQHEQDAEKLTLWVETTAFGAIKLRAWASNLGGGGDVRRRRLFDPDRLGLFDGSDRRTREEGVTLGVGAGGSF
jgi:outer membrane receptor protein involved in Fe transport